MASRLDRLFILLESGTNPVTKRAAAEQLGEAQRLHPHELHHLLSRVSVLLKSPQWDTRISAAHAIQEILSQVPVWDPEPMEESPEGSPNREFEDDKDYLTLEGFDMEKVLAKSSHLTGSAGSEYDLVIADGEQNATHGAQGSQLLTAKLGFHPRLMGIDTADLFTPEDLTLPSPSSSQSSKVPVDEHLSMSQGGLSRREMNRARRKARQSMSKQRSGEPDEQELNVEVVRKRMKMEDVLAAEDRVIESVSSGAVPDVTGCWPEIAMDWPLKAFSENLTQDLFSQKWEVRHGAATALRDLVRLHGQGAGKCRGMTKEEMRESNRRWVIDTALRLLCVLGLDRFGDFVSDQVVAPVRETCAQALGALVMLMPPDEDKGVLGILNVVLKLLDHDEWEARHGALLALKFVLPLRDELLEELLPLAYSAAMRGFADAVDDVGAAAASALIPIASHLPELLKPDQLQSIVARLWELLKEQDDLAAACNSFMGLLAAILSRPAARCLLPPQPLSRVLPRLWPFLGHASSSVRKATLETLRTLTGEDDHNPNDSRRRWGDEGGVVLQEALRHVFQRVLVEHYASIQDVAESVWSNLLTESDLEMLLHAACPLVSTWLCLAMQPDHVPFSPGLMNVTTSNLLKNPRAANGDGQSDSGNSAVGIGGKPNSELKVYIGGIETVPNNVRLANIVRARIMASRMLGLLSRYIVQPAPGVIYSPDVPSPALCYARVLLAHLGSRSALQRTVTGLTISHWAAQERRPPEIPDILRDKLLACLNECFYYDEIAGAFTRLLHESRDYIATLKHYKLCLPIEVENSSVVISLDQITTLAAKPVSSMQVIGANGTPSPNKLKPKLITELEERRRALEIGVRNTTSQQIALNTMAMAALAGAATMLRILPEPPSPLNPLIKPLMESVKREENEELQKLAAQYLAHLVDFCAERDPSPNNKIITNLCTFLCSDTEFTPRVGDKDLEPFDGILTMNNRHREAERETYNRGSGAGGIGGGRGPGRPPATDIPLEEILACEEPEAKASRTRRRGATFALTSIASVFWDTLQKRLPKLWEIMVLNNLEQEKKEAVEVKTQEVIREEVNNLIFGLQVLEVVAPSLEKGLLPQVLACLSRLCELLGHQYKGVRHMAARCIATLAVLHTGVTMQYVVKYIVPLLETRTAEAGNAHILTAPNQLDVKRQGAAEALACIVDKLEVKVVPYAVLFMVPLLGRMSDQNQAVRLACNATFATLIQLLPLDPGAISDAPNLIKEKAQETRFLEQLLNPSSIPDTKLPIPVAAELRSYQQQGLNWLDFLNRYRLHGVLCDDMGLGKTLQTLCMLALDHHRNPNAPPSLVVCPPTLTGHWVYEAEKFLQAKDLSVIQYAGTPPDREKLRPRVPHYRLVVASYDIVRKDFEFFENIQWNYCVLDEGHIIKNGKTKSAKAAKRLHAHHRLILSGTPVQNDVLELWSLFDFLMPGFLGTEKQFAAKYSRPILACRDPKADSSEQEAGALALEALHRQVLPFLLRRNKEDVLEDLPPKITQDYYCDLSPLQRSLYEDFKTRHSATLMPNSQTSSGSPAPQRGHVFEALRYLRNVCNHPKLVLNEKHPMYANIATQQINLAEIGHGAKLPALKQLLLESGIGDKTQASLNDIQQAQPQLVSQHRALIFCQLKAMLDIVEKDLLAVHLPTVTYLRLDGSVPAAQRHSVVARFNADPSIDVLLLTTQVGGLGLNLTGADTVIFVEHDWNPMKDLQAMDRAHRIGQKKVVNVYRLITRNTVEEKIMGLQKFKLHTANTVISTDNAALETMGTDQLLNLFSLDNGKERKSNEVGTSNSIPAIPGLSKAVLDILPELWEQQQYDDEYDVDSYLTTLEGNKS